MHNLRLPLKNAVSGRFHARGAACFILSTCPCRKRPFPQSALCEPTLVRPLRRWTGGVRTDDLKHLPDLLLSLPPLPCCAPLGVDALPVFATVLFHRSSLPLLGHGLVLRSRQERALTCRCLIGEACEARQTSLPGLRRECRLALLEGCPTIGPCQGCAGDDQKSKKKWIPKQPKTAEGVL